MTKRDDLIALRDAVEAGSWTVTHWRDFAALPTGDADNPGPILAHRAYHGSLDAALALHEGLLPGWAWGVETDDEPPHDFSAVVLRSIPEGAPWSVFYSGAAKPARAFLLAILEALIAQEDASASD